MPCGIYISNNRRLLRGPVAPISQRRRGNCCFGKEATCVCVKAWRSMYRQASAEEKLSHIGEFVRDFIEVCVFHLTSSSSGGFAAQVCLCCWVSSGRQREASAVWDSSVTCLSLAGRSLLSAQDCCCAFWMVAVTWYLQLPSLVSPFLCLFEYAYFKQIYGQLSVAGDDSGCVRPPALNPSITM